MKIAIDNPDFIIVKHLTNGATFGEIALTENEKRTASIICDENTECISISKQAFKTILCLFLKILFKIV